MVQIRLQLATQANDGVVDRPGIGQVGVAPHDAQQLGTAHHRAASFRKVAKQFEVAMAQVDPTAVVPGSKGIEVDDYVVEHEPAHPDARPSENGMDPCQQLFEVEWLADIVVCAKAKTLDLVVFVAPDGQEDDRQIAGGPKKTAELETTQVGEHHVEQCQIRREFFRAS